MADSTTVPVKNNGFMGGHRGNEQHGKVYGELCDTAYENESLFKRYH